MWLMFYFVIILISPSQAQVDFSGLYINELIMLKKTAGDKNEAAKLHARAMESHKKKDYKESERLWYLTAKADRW